MRFEARSPARLAPNSLAREEMGWMGRLSQACLVRWGGGEWTALREEPANS